MHRGRLSRAGAVLAVSFAAAVIASATPAFGQTGRVAGTVKEEKGEAIKGATIVADNPDATPHMFMAVSDERGRFAFASLAQGLWTFRVGAAGYVVAGTQRIINPLRPNPAIEFRLTRGTATVPTGALAGVDTKALQGELDAAQALFEAKRYDQALAAYQAVLTRAPQLTLVHAQIGRIHSARGNDDKALAAYELALAADADNVRVLLGIGLAAGRKGDQEKATRALRRVIDLVPGSAEAADARTALDSMVKR
jgi:tetratricopeptide (TPR) repeat protein